MLNLTLRIVLLVITFLYVSLMIKLVRKRKLKGTLSIFWIITGILLFVSIIFPQIVVSIAHLLGFEAASNMIFVIAIFILFYLIFNLTIHISIQSKENVELIQEISILKNRIEELEKTGREL